MPIYEYHCRTCKKDFEVMQKITDEPLAACPDCGKKVKRIISQTSFSLKGGGWYKDGYSGSSSGGGKKTAAKTETPKTESKKAEPKKTE